jgi:hypothetical protein
MKDKGLSAAAAAAAAAGCCCYYCCLVNQIPNSGKSNISDKKNFLILKMK